MSAFSKKMRRERAAAILDATFRLAARRGWTSFTIDQVAAEAGVAKGTVYLHFRSKEDLLAALAGRASHEICSVVSGEASSQHNDPLSRLLCVFERCLKEPAFRNLLAMTLASIPVNSREAQICPVQELLDSISGLLVDGQYDANASTFVSPPATAAALVGLLLFLSYNEGRPFATNHAELKRVLKRIIG